MMDGSEASQQTDGDGLVLFPGKLIRKNGALAFEGPLAHFFLTVSMGKAVWSGKISEREELCIGVRARDIHLDGPGGRDDINIAGRVESVLSEGVAQRVKVRTANRDIDIHAEGPAPLGTGDAVRLHFSRNRAMLYRCAVDKINPSLPPVPLAAI